MAAVLALELGLELILQAAAAVAAKVAREQMPLAARLLEETLRLAFIARAMSC
jgi:hypothetical protein